MPSFQSRLLVGLLRLTRRKRIYSSAQSVLNGIAQVRQQGPARPSARMMSRLDVQHQVVDGIEVYRLAPKATSTATRHLLYLHGGAYIRPITVHHWRFLQALVEAEGYTITVPLYPLAPEATCTQAVEAAVAVYQHTCSAEQVASLSVMGDSAGGGLALALCYALRERGERLPASLVLICPWLDVRMTHPAIAAHEQHDPMLAAVGLKEAGRLYAGDLPADHPYVSPIKGELAGLPPTLLFAGTRDIACHDELQFVELTRAAGVQVELQLGEGLIHVWPILPIPEGKAARQVIARHLREYG